MKRLRQLAPFRKIVKWIGPAAKLVELECGHEVETYAAHKTRCRKCRRVVIKKKL